MNENNHLNRVLAALYGSFDYRPDCWFRDNNQWVEVQTWEYWEVIRSQALVISAWRG